MAKRSYGQGKPAGHRRDASGIIPEEACRKAAQRVLMQLKYRGKDPSKYQACFLALDKQGQYGACSMQPGFTYAVQDMSQGNRLLAAPYVWSKP